MANAQFDVGDFSSKISGSGLASPNKFEVIFTKIPGQNDSGTREQLSLMCDQCSLAGRDVQAQLDIQYGIRRQVVYNAPSYTPLSLSFICTDNKNEKRILDNWNNFFHNVIKSISFYSRCYLSYVTKFAPFWKTTTNFCGYSIQ